MNITKKHSLYPAVVVLSCCLLLAGACENTEGLGTEVQSGDVPLHFKVDMVKTTASETRAFTPVEDFTGKSYSFGLSVTKDNEAKGEVFPGSGDMTAVMDNFSTKPEVKWEFKDNATGSIVTTPTVPVGKPLRIIAYYPSVKGTGAFKDGIPFDFTKVIAPKQEEILYNMDTTITVQQPSSGNKAVIPLKFQHAYSWIVINITKYMDKGTYKLTDVNIDNLLGERIKNKGFINPATGLCMPGAKAGPIGESRAGGESIPYDQALVSSPLKYEFLVPAFMDSSVSNENIIITMTINGTKEIFPLQRMYLNRDGDKYGFRQGYKNTYNIVFDNSSLSLRILNWSSVVITENFGEKETFSNEIAKADYDNTSVYYWPSKSGLAKSNFFSAGSDEYETYLTTVAYGSNGSYVPEKRPTSPPTGSMYVCDDDWNVRDMENVYSKCWITKKDVSSAPVPWEDEKGQLLAKELCRKYRGGGYHDWRLPRASEFRGFMVFASFSSAQQIVLGLQNRERNLFWTATEVDESRAWAASYYYNQLDLINRGPLLYPQDKRTVEAAVRCVRIPKPGDK